MGAGKADKKVIIIAGIVTLGIVVLGAIGGGVAGGVISGWGSGSGSSSGSSNLQYYGVRQNLNPSSLSSSWSLCYSRTYATVLSSSSVATLLDTCNKSKLLIGCRSVSSSYLIVGAMGDRDDVLYNCGTQSTCRRVANGVAWYYSNLYSWGFAGSGDSVNRNPCDTLTTNGANRMCWRTNNGGGESCGTNTGLTSSTSYYKVVYHSD